MDGDGAGADSDETQRIIVVNGVDGPDLNGIEVWIAVPGELFIEVLTHDDHRFLTVFADMDRRMVITD